MKVLILGGSKSGKSSYAEQAALTLSKGGRHYYIATMIPFDEEDQERIRKHQAKRAHKGFETIEQGHSVEKCLEKADPHAVFLLDSITALLLNEQFLDEQSQAGQKATSGSLRCLKGLLTLADSVQDIVFVSDYIFSDAARYEDYTENFRASLGFLHTSLAKACDTVIELCAGNVICHKGEPFL